MSQSIVTVNVAIPNADANGVDLDPSIFRNQIAPLCVNSEAGMGGQLDTFDQNGVYKRQYYILTFFLLASNTIAALNKYTAYIATLAPNTPTYVWYSTQTLGV